MVSNKSSKFSLKSSTGFKVAGVSLLGVSLLAGIAAPTVLSLSHAYNASAISDEDANKIKPLQEAIAKADRYDANKYSTYFDSGKIKLFLDALNLARQNVHNIETGKFTENLDDIVSATGSINQLLNDDDAITVWKEKGAKAQLDSEMALAVELGEGKLDANAYSKESYSAYSKAYDAVKAVYDANVEYKGNNGAATKGIDAATENLKKAVAALVKVSGVKGDNNSESNSGNSKNDNQTGDADNSGNSNLEVTKPSASNNGASESKVTAPNTGAEL